MTFSTAKTLGAMLHAVSLFFDVLRGRDRTPVEEISSISAQRATGNGAEAAKNVSTEDVEFKQTVSDYSRSKYKPSPAAVERVVNTLVFHENDISQVVLNLISCNDVFRTHVRQGFETLLAGSNLSIEEKKRLRNLYAALLRLW